jgi:serine/threonine protein phosphatase 1
MIGIIGDIHGCFYTLSELVRDIRKKYAGIKIYCVGDLVDRGNFSFEVIDFIQKEQINFTPGNHDYMFYYFMKNPSSLFASAWLYNGYENTLRSYEDRYEKLGEHLELIKSAPLYYNLEDCFISHAGISVAFKGKLGKNPISDIEKLDKSIINNLESESGILWTRDDLLDLGKLQVVGHTRKDEIEFNEKNNSVYIDTSAYSGIKLSTIIVEKGKIMDTLSVSTKSEDIPSLDF